MLDFFRYIIILHTLDTHSRLLPLLGAIIYLQVNTQNDTAVYVTN